MSVSSLDLRRSPDKKSVISRMAYFKSTNQRLMANGNSGAGRKKVQGKERRVSPLHTGIEANSNSGAGRKKCREKKGE